MSDEHENAHIQERVLRGEYAVALALLHAFLTACDQPISDEEMQRFKEMLESGDPVEEKIENLLKEKRVADALATIGGKK